MDRSLLSIVVPIFNEEEVLPELVRRLAATIPTLGFEAAEVVLSMTAALTARARS